MAEPQKRLLKTSSRDTGELLQNEQAYYCLKEMILLGEAAPLSMLEEKKLMVQLGLGRTPIREALLRLSYENLVTILPFRGMFVAGLDIADYEEALEMRLPTEVLTARLAADRMSDTAIQALRQEIEDAQISALCESHDTQALLALDTAFHQALSAGAQNRFLEKSLDNLRDISWRFHALYQRRQQAAPRNPTAHYEAILAAVAQRDPDGAAVAMTQYLTDASLRAGR